MEGTLDPGPYTLQNQTAEMLDGAQLGNVDVSDFQGAPGQKEGKTFGTAANVSHLQASENTAAGDVSTQQPLQGSHIEAGFANSQIKTKNATGANLDDSLITSGAGTNVEASNIQTSHIQPGIAD